LTRGTLFVPNVRHSLVVIRGDVVVCC